MPSDSIPSHRHKTKRLIFYFSSHIVDLIARSRNKKEPTLLSLATALSCFSVLTGQGFALTIHCGCLYQNRNLIPFSEHYTTVTKYYSCKNI